MPKDKRIWVLVIRDPRDASRDYMIPKPDAMHLLQIGRLHWDATNQAFATPRVNDAPVFLEEWKR